MPTVACPQCGASLKIPDAAIGKKARCKRCQTIFPVSSSPCEPADADVSAVDMARGAAAQVANAAGEVIRAVGSLVPSSQLASGAATVSSSVNSLISRLTVDDQEIDKTTAIVERIQQILMAGEELEYVAIQAKPIVNWFPDAVVLTSRRFIIYRPKILGRVEFEDYIWRDLRDVRLQEDLIGATLSFETSAGDEVALDYLPKKQARQLYRLAQEHEQISLEERRERAMEEQRAASGGGIVIQNAIGSAAAPKPAPADPVVRLRQLKQMLEAELISQADFDAKKAEILAQM